MKSLQVVLLAVLCLLVPGLPLADQKYSSTIREASSPSDESVEVASKIPEETVKNEDNVPSYGQSPDASDLGVPVDHIPVQESIVKSLIEEHSSDEKTDLSEDLAELHRSATRNSGNQVLPEKVSVKLYATFTATANELPSNSSKDRLNETVAWRVGGSLPASLEAASIKDPAHSSASKDGKPRIGDKVDLNVQKSAAINHHQSSATSRGPVESTTLSSNFRPELAYSIDSDHRKYDKIGEKIKPIEAASINQHAPSTAVSSSPITSTSSSPSVSTSEVASASAPLISGKNKSPQVSPDTSQDIAELIADPVDQATKLLIDLEEQVQLYLKSEKREDLPITTSTSLVYGLEADSEITVKQGATQIQSLIDEVNRVAKNVETVITELVTGRRYMTAAMFRSLLNYLRRVRISLERLQTRMQVLGVPGAGSVASSSASSSPSPGGVLDTPSASSPAPSITQSYLEQIRERILRITEEITTLMNRLRGSFESSSTAAPQSS